MNSLFKAFVAVATISAIAVSCSKDNGGIISPDLPGEFTDLSPKGTANCYLVSSAGKYKFKATVKGNSTTSVGTPTKAEVLWETFGTSTTPTVGSVVTNVSYSSGYVTFATPSTLNNGNAVVAVKDASGEILWSWHIWVCKDFDPKATAQVYKNSAGTMMDRNLGATSAAKGSVGALGLLYQWGRKDPFLGSNSISSNTVAASTLSWPSEEYASAHLSGTNTLSYSISHPTTYLKTGNVPFDWYCTSSKFRNDNLWSSSKTMYDPCPTGWRVPDGGSSCVWSKAFGTSSYYSSGPWDSANKGMDFGSGNGKSGSMQLGSSTTIWYPAACYRGSGDGSLGNAGIYGGYWSCTPTGYYAYRLYFDNLGNVYQSDDLDREDGRSVRCLSE